MAKAYAIQAGREIRVIVENEALDYLGCQILAGDIAEKIEKEKRAELAALPAEPGLSAEDVAASVRDATGAVARAWAVAGRRA